MPRIFKPADLPHFHTGADTKDVNGFGKVTRGGVRKLSGADQDKVKDSLERLILLKPRLVSEIVKEEFHSDALRIYFAPLGIDPTKNEPKPKQLSKFARGVATGDLTGGIMDNLHRKLVAAEKRNFELDATIKLLQKATGEKTKAEAETTLETCLNHFEKYFRAASEEQRVDVFRRVKTVVKLLGLETKYGNVTKHRIEDAVVKSAAVSESENFKRKQAIKRFFKFLALPINEGGLGLTSNPAANLYVGSVGSIQAKRIQTVGIEILNPKDVLALKDLTPYHRALFAVIGYAGLRLAEAAGLLWSDLDFETKTIRIQPNEIHKGLKTENSKRLVKPFTNLWPIVSEWKKQTERKKDSDLVFYRATTGGSWFVEYHGKPRVTALTHFLRDELKRRGMMNDKEPARRLRRWWSTTMQQRGHGALESIMAGHSERTAATHYTEREIIVLGAVIGNADLHVSTER